MRMGFTNLLKISPSGMLAINIGTPQDSPPVAFPPSNIDLKQHKFQLEAVGQLDTGSICSI